MQEDILLQISQRLRDLRKEKNITLQELADQAGVTKSLISQIENSRTIPSLIVLLTLIRSLETDLNQFFKDINLNPSEEKVLLRKRESYQPFEKEDASGFHYHRILTTQWHEYHIDVVLLTLMPGATRLPVSTKAFELKYLLSGAVTYRIADKDYLMEVGDTLFFDGRESHVPVNHGPSPATMLVIYFFEPAV